MLLYQIHEAGPRPPRQRQVGEAWIVVPLSLDELDGVAASRVEHSLIDVDLTRLATALRLRAFLGRARRGLRIFACHRGHRHAAIQAGALGATHLLDKPVADAALLEILPTAEDASAPGEPGPSTVLATIALDGAFRRFRTGEPLASGEVGGVAGGLTREIAAIGLAPWLGSIRTHHVGTYQHCLTVTGLATAFGSALGFSRRDMSDLTSAALLHDIGKARIPTALLDKPTVLTESERRLFQQHPVWGHEYLAARSDAPKRVLSAVRHHHEYLDGSGYPDGLAGRQIDDLTRLLTISDIFGALIEERAYKPPMPADAAFAILRKMVAAGQLEAALVEAFVPVVGMVEGEPKACGTPRAA